METMMEIQSLNNTKYISAKKLLYINQNYSSVINYLWQNSNVRVYLDRKKSVRSRELFILLQRNASLKKLSYNELITFIENYIFIKCFENDFTNFNNDY